VQTNLDGNICVAKDTIFAHGVIQTRKNSKGGSDETDTTIQI
jgi:hypothetical protein